jgi:hypothetical protein
MASNKPRRINIPNGVIVRLAELSGAFQWGILLVTDASSKEQIPDWSSPDEQVTAAGSALVVRVMPDVEGNVDVYVVNSDDEVHGTRVFSGRLAVPSMMLKIGDALGGMTTSVALGKAEIGIDVFLDEPIEASAVSLLLRD